MASRDVNDICFRCRNHLLDPWDTGKPVDKEWKVLFDCPYQQYHCIGHRQCQTHRGLGRRNAKCPVCQSPKLPKPIIVTSVDDIYFQKFSKGSNDDILYPVFRVRTPEPDVDNSTPNEGSGRGSGRGRGRGTARGRGGVRGRSAPEPNSGQSRSRSGDRTRRSGLRTAGEQDDVASPEEGSLLSSDAVSAGRATRAAAGAIPAADERDTESDNAGDGNPNPSRSTSATPSVSPRGNHSVSPARSSPGASQRRIRSVSPARSSPGASQSRNRSVSPARSSLGASQRRSRSASPMLSGPADEPVAPLVVRWPDGRESAYIPAVAGQAAGAAADPAAGAADAAADPAADAAADPAADAEVDPAADAEVDPAADAADAAADAAVGAAADQEPAAEFVDLTDSPFHAPIIHVTIENYTEKLEAYLEQLVSSVGNDLQSLCEVISKLIDTIGGDVQYKCNSLVRFFRNIIMKIYEGQLDRWKLRCETAAEPFFKPCSLEDGKYIEIMVEHVNRVFDRMIRRVTMHNVGTSFRNLMIQAIYNLTRAHSFLITIKFMQEGQYESHVVLVSKLIVKVYDETKNLLRDKMPSILRDASRSYGSYYLSDDDMNVISFNEIEFCRYSVRFASICVFEMLRRFLKLRDVNPNTDIGTLGESVNEKNYEAYLILSDLVMQRVLSDSEQIITINRQSGRVNTEIGEHNLKGIKRYLTTMRHSLRAYETSGEKKDWKIWKHLVPALVSANDAENIKNIRDMHCIICMNPFVNGPEFTTDRNGVQHSLKDLALRFSCMHVFHVTCLDQAMVVSCPLCRTPFSRRQADNSPCDILFTTGDIINNSQITDSGRHGLAVDSRLKMLDRLQPRVLTDEERAEQERELRENEARKRNRQDMIRELYSKSARQHGIFRSHGTVEKNSSHGDKDDGQKRRRLASPQPASSSEVEMGADSAADATAIATSVQTAAAESITAATKPTTAAAEPIPAATEPTTAAAEPTTAAAEPTTAATEPTTAAPKPTAAAAAHHGPAPETGRLTALLARASDVGTAAPRLRLPRSGGAKPKLAIDSVIQKKPGTSKFLKSLRKYLRMMILVRRGEKIRLPTEGFDLFYDENDVLDFIREFERLINELESVVYDVTEISPYVERVLAGDEATCAELLAIYDRIDAEGAGA